MWEGLRLWFERRAARRRRWRNEARTLASLEGRAAYYEAHRLAARSRARGERAEFLHWSKVAAEIARISPQAEMDIDVVRTIVDTEIGRHRPGAR